MKLTHEHENPRISTLAHAQFFLNDLERPFQVAATDTQRPGYIVGVVDQVRMKQALTPKVFALYLEVSRIVRELERESEEKPEAPQIQEAAAT